MQEGVQGRGDTPGVLPYPNDPDYASNTAAHDAVRFTLKIDETTPEAEYKTRLLDDPLVLHRLAVTQGLFGRMETVAAVARGLVETVSIPEGAATHTGGEDTEAEIAVGTEATLGEQQQAARGQKRRKDGGIKQSGGKEGEPKGKHYTLYFKYSVVQEYRRMQKLKPQGFCDAPQIEVAESFGVHQSLVSKWARQEEALREALIHGNVVHGKGRKARLKDQLVAFSSRAARKVSLQPGRSCKFAAAEAETYAQYREKRSKGLKVSGIILRTMMKKNVRKHYGTEAAFKASTFWLRSFAHRYSISIRKGSNTKNKSAAEKMPKIQRWHARFRRRLSRGKQLDPKWGRWLPEDRISTDQVPCNLREGDGRTYADKGSSRVWIAGPKADAGKRFCTLQISARCKNGDRRKPRHGQPKLTIVFRGQGEPRSRGVVAAEAKPDLRHHQGLSSKFLPERAPPPRAQASELAMRSVGHGTPTCAFASSPRPTSTTSFARTMQRRRSRRSPPKRVLLAERASSSSTISPGRPRRRTSAS